MIDENSLVSKEEDAEIRGSNSEDPRFFFWKAKHSCTQAESVCNVARFTEKVRKGHGLFANIIKTYITYFMMGSNALAIVILFLNGIFILGQTSVIGIKRGSSWINQ